MKTTAARPIEDCEMSLEPFVRALLIRPHQARVPGHVGCEDRGKAANGSHLSAGRLLA